LEIFIRAVLRMLYSFLAHTFEISGPAASAVSSGEASFRIRGALLSSSSLFQKMERGSIAEPGVVGA
jgi:hypothetical protein